MKSAERATGAQIARIVKECLNRGRAVEIDGLGAFRPDAHGGFAFEPQVRPKVFLAYVVEDHALVERLYDDLVRGGMDAWLDRRKLMAGQNWPRAIERAISVSDFFVACFSERSIAKRGKFHSELRYALDCAANVPLEEVFFIPVRLEDCKVPVRIASEFQYVDLFPNWGKGVERVLAAIRKQLRARQPRVA
jgi:hypothetical protein